MERRIVLLGKTGSGKSATGNTILKGSHFEVQSSPSSVTKQCVKKTSGHITVIDTPGILDKSPCEEELKKEIEQCIYMSLPGPHVFLLVIKLDRFTEKDWNAVKEIQCKFGEIIFDHTIILFTGADQLRNRCIEEFISENEVLKQVLFCCGFRYHVFNNNDTNPSQVKNLMLKIEKLMRKNGGMCYTSELYERAQKKKRNNFIIKSLVIGAIIAVGAIGVGLSGTIF